VLKLAPLFLGVIASCGGAVALQAQPSYEAPPPSRVVIQDQAERRAGYLSRLQELRDWRLAQFDWDDPESTPGYSEVAFLLHRNERIEVCNRRVIELMRTARTGPFGMFPNVILAYVGRDKLSPEARGAIRDSWRRLQLRGDTENHWLMYYTSLYLISQLYPNEPGETWYTGKSSEENLEEARGWLLEWMNLTTTIGQGEYNASYYYGKYAVTMLMLAALAEDEEMRKRGQIMLDWFSAELANVTLEGVLRGPNSRTDERAIPERWNAPVTTFSWLLFGNTPPFKGYGFAVYFATLAEHYEIPEVIYRIATDRSEDIMQRDRARTRRIWRYSDEHMPAIYKTQYLRRDYAVGSQQGRLSDPLQSHVWDVTWREEDPRDKHNTMFSLHPYASGKVMQMFFSVYPEPLEESLASAGKPSYSFANKILGSSPYEKVFQDLDTVIALYQIEPGERYAQINGFFSKDLQHVTEHDSGWIFAQGGETYLAYRPLAPYEWTPHYSYLPSVTKKRTYEPHDSGGRILVSPHLKNGTIVQAASVDEFASFEAFQTAMIALPLEYSLDPVPTVKMTTLRGKEVSFTYGETPLVNGSPLDYAEWKLFAGTHLNAELGSRILTITHGALKRVLDLNTLTITNTP